MKMQKLDPKQVPQVIALGVVSVGVFGYAVFTFAGSGPKPDTAAAATKTSTATTGEAGTSASSTTGSTTAETKMALSVAEAGADPAHPGAAPAEGAPGINLPGQYNPDPFKAAAKPDVAPQAVEVTPKPAPAPVKPQIKAPALPDATGKGGLMPPVTLVTPPPVPAGPERPEVRVTGTSVVDGLNLAIVEIGPEHRVVQVGDVVSKGYRVKKIQLQGVVFAKEKDHFFQGVGAKSDPNKPDNAEGKPTQL